jgi:uncharacterized protein (TIGR03437 family)
MKQLFSILLGLSLGSALSFAAVVNYSYDAAGRLTKVDYGANGTITYTYDKGGNVLSRTVAAGNPTTPLITKVNMAWGDTDIAPNAWIEVKGNNLVPADTPSSGVVWSSAPEFAQGKMPTKLGNVSVTVNGKPAYIYFFCSAATSSCATDQINVLTPLDSGSGAVNVVVTNGSTSTAAFTATVKPAAPTFLFFTPAGNVIAQHQDFKLVGPTSLFPGATTPATKNETVILYTVGFGLPTNTLSEGASSQGGALQGPVACTVDGKPASTIAALISPGLYQVNVTVPGDAKSGDDAISCTYQGVKTQSGAILAVQ